MFVRVVQARDKKYAQVVESFRVSKGSKHRLLWSLGHYDEHEHGIVSQKLRSWQRLERASIIIREVKECYGCLQAKPGSTQ